MIGKYYGRAKETDGGTFFEKIPVVFEDGRCEIIRLERSKDSEYFYIVGISTDSSGISHSRRFYKCARIASNTRNVLGLTVWENALEEDFPGVDTPPTNVIHVKGCEGLEADKE